MVKQSQPVEVSGPAVVKRGAEKRSHILNVALTLFADRGYDGVSIRAVAQAAGVDHPLVKYHFTDKDTLWREAVRHLFDRMNLELRQISFPSFRDDADAAFKDVIRALVRYNARHPEHARLMVQESVSDNGRIKWAAETFIRRQHAGISPWLEASIKHGFLPDIPRHELVTMLNALCHITFTLAPMVRYSWDVEFGGEASIDAHCHAVLALLGHGK
jgi:AcrR family transcriptional regulator